MNKRVTMAVLMSVLLNSGANYAAAAPSPYADVPLADNAYTHIRTLAGEGLINKEYGTRFSADRLATRLELAAVAANASTKYEQATPAQKTAIRELQMEFKDELQNMGISVVEDGKMVEKSPSVNQRVDNLEKKQQENEEKFKWLPKVSGEFKQYYDWKHSKKDGKKFGSYSAVYQDVRLGLNGKIGDDWSYLLGWQIIGVSQQGLTGGYRTETNLNYRNSLNPDMQLFIAQVSNWNFYGGKLFMGKFWNGFVTNLEPTVYTDAFRGIGYAHPVGKVNLSASYGVLDWNPASSTTFDDSIAPRGQRYTLDTTQGKWFLGAAYWKFDNLVNPYTYNPAWGMYKKEIMHNLKEGQIKYSFDKKNNLSLFYGRSDADIENSFMILRYVYGNIDLQKKGSYLIGLNYHKIGSNSVLDPGVVEMYQNESRMGLKGFGLNFNFVPYKSVLWKNEFNLFNHAITDSSIRSTTFRSILDFIF